VGALKLTYFKSQGLPLNIAGSGWANLTVLVEATKDI
jgi:hypothetical protein